MRNQEGGREKDRGGGGGGGGGGVKSTSMKGWFLNEDRRERDEEAPVHMLAFQLFIILRSAGSKVKSTSMFSSILSGFVDYAMRWYDAVWHTECEVCGAQVCEGLHLKETP